MGHRDKECGREPVSIFSRDIDFHLTVPARRPIKSVYIRKFIDMIDEINDKTAKGVTK